MVPRKSEKIAASRALGTSWILLLAMIGTLSELCYVQGYVGPSTVCLSVCHLCGVGHHWMDCILIIQKQMGISYLDGRGKISLAVMG